MTPISAVIITFNEEKNIDACISSISKVANDIVVVDSFSTDKTEELCKKYSAVQFVSQEWLGYAEQKNFGHKIAKHDWIISIDADEILSDELTDSIQHHLGLGLKGVYQCKRLTNYCGSWIKHCGWYPDTKTRIFNKNDVKWIGLIHEELEHNEISTLLKGDLLHYSYHSIQQHISQINKYTDFGAQEDFNKGKKVTLLKTIFYPLWKFIRDYIFNMGILDGYHGFIVCAISAQATFLKSIKIRELHKNQSIKKH